MHYHININLSWSRIIADYWLAYWVLLIISNTTSVNGGTSCSLGTADFFSQSSYWRINLLHNYDRLKRFSHWKNSWFLTFCFRFFQDGNIKRKIIISKTRPTNKRNAKIVTYSLLELHVIPFMWWFLSRFY